jgi:hypothetical protein
VCEREIELLFWIMLTNRSLPFLTFAPTKLVLPTQLPQSAAILEFRVLEHFCNGVVSPVPYISQ